MNPPILSREFRDGPWSDSNLQPISVAAQECAVTLLASYSHSHWVGSVQNFEVIIFGTINAL